MCICVGVCAHTHICVFICFIKATTLKDPGTFSVCVYAFSILSINVEIFSWQVIRIHEACFSGRQPQIE